MTTEERLDWFERRINLIEREHKSLLRVALRTGVDEETFRLSLEAVDERVGGLDAGTDKRIIATFDFLLKTFARVQLLELEVTRLKEATHANKS